MSAEPESKTICPNTGGKHSFVYDTRCGEWVCDECGVSESQQEFQEFEDWQRKSVESEK